MVLCYNFASRERPQKFFDCLDNIECYSESNHYFVVVKLDNNDPTADEYRKRLHEYPKVIVRWGESSCKIDAVNRGLEDIPPYDILMNHSDDFWFTEYGYDNVVREAFVDWDGLVHFPDQKAGSQLITYAMMHRDYYNLHGYVYHTDFKSVYCDNYQQLQAQKLGKYKFVNKAILEHRHFIWGYGKKDSLLERTEDPITYAKDKETFDRLKSEL